MKHLATFAATALVALSTAAHGQETLEGRPRIIDGDTIIVEGQRVRLEGIDAPELNQPCRDTRLSRTRWCGQTAKHELDEIVGHRIDDSLIPVTCYTSGEDRYGRALATCYNSDGSDIADEVVRRGWALAYRRYSTAYVKAEQEARGARNGLWAPNLAFTPPWEWRRSHR